MDKQKDSDIGPLPELPNDKEAKPKDGACAECEPKKKNTPSKVKAANHGWSQEYHWQGQNDWLVSH